MAKNNEINPLFITEADQYVFAQGSHYEIIYNVFILQSCISTTFDLLV